MSLFFNRIANSLKMFSEYDTFILRNAKINLALLNNNVDLKKECIYFNIQSGNLELVIDQLKDLNYNERVKARQFSELLYNKEFRGDMLFPFGKTIIFIGAMSGFTSFPILFAPKFAYEVFVLNRRGLELRSQILEIIKNNSKTIER